MIHVHIQVAIGAAYGNRTNLSISTIYNSIYTLVGQEIQRRAATRASRKAQAQTSHIWLSNSSAVGTKFSNTELAPIAGLS
jgi:hypothetical protein